MLHGIYSFLPGLHCRPARHYLLQVGFALAVLVCRADFGATDSDNLASVADDVYWIRQSGFGGMASDVATILQYVESVSLDVADIADGVSAISDDVSAIRSDVSAISSNLGSTLGYVEDIKDEVVASGGHLNNLDTNVSEIRYALQALTNGFVANISLAVSNALASVPLCYNVATNLSAGVDLTMVTNLATYLIGNIDPLTFNGGFGGMPLYELLSDYIGALYGDGYDESDFDMLWASSFLGFLQYLHLSALFPTTVGHTDFPGYNTVWDYWHNGSFAGLPSPEYTIFDAYNTIGITNRLVDLSITNSFWGSQIVDLLSDLTNKFARASSASSASASALASISNAVEVSSQEDLDHSVSYTLPEWEPTYKSHVDGNTNFYYYQAQLNDMSDKLFRSPTQRMSQVFSSLRSIQPSEMSFGLSWSGINDSNVHTGWDLYLTLAENLPDVREFRSYVKTCSKLVFYVLQLCVGVFFLRRIHQIATGNMKP